MLYIQKIIIIMVLFTFPMKNYAHSPKQLIEEILAYADVKINGDRPSDIQVHDDRFYQRVLKDRSLGFGNRIWTAGGTRPPSTNVLLKF